MGDGDAARDIALGLVGILGQARQQAEIGVRSGGNQRMCRVIGRHVKARRQCARIGRLGEHAQRCGARERPLSHALWPGEQPGMVQRAAVQCRAKGPVRGLVAERQAHNQSASAASKAAVTASAG